METVVKMVTQVAGEEVFVGECHPARARVLVKKQLASWLDGKVLLHVLHVHDKLLASNPEAWSGPLDDRNVSKQEMERRIAWFRSFMEKSARALTADVVELPTVEEAEKWAKPMAASVSLPNEARAQIVFPFTERLRLLFAEDGFDAGSKEGQAQLGQVRKDIREAVLLKMAEAGAVTLDSWSVAGDLMEEAINAGITDEEAASYFDEGAPFEAQVFEESVVESDPIESMWETVPDVTGVFASPAPLTLSDYLDVEEPDLPGLPPEFGMPPTTSPKLHPLTTGVAAHMEPLFDPDTYKARLERDQRLIEATHVALYEEPPKVIASLRQVEMVRGIRRDPEDIVRTPSVTLT